MHVSAIRFQWWVFLLLVQRQHNERLFSFDVHSKLDLLSQTVTKLNSCVAILSRVCLFVARRLQRDGINRVPSSRTSPCAAVSAIKISRSHFNACANSPDLKTCGQNKTAKQIGPMAELRWPPGTEQLRPWQLGSTDSHCDHRPPPSSHSSVDTVAAVFRVDGAQTGTDAGNAAQLERRAGRRLLGEKKAPAVNSSGLWRVYGAAIGFSKQIKAKGA